MTSPHGNDEWQRYTYPAPPPPMGDAGPPPGYAPYGPYPMAPVKQTDSLAIVSLVLSILGFTTCGVAAVIGVILGYSARRRIRESPATLEGEGMAKAGIVIGWVVVGLHALAVLAYAAFFGFFIYMGTQYG